MSTQKQLEKQFYTNLTDYIQKIYLNYGYNKQEIPWRLLTAQIKNMKIDGLTYAGVQLTLEFMYENKNMDMLAGSENGSILNLVPFYYNSAKQDWIANAELKNKIYEFDFKEEIKIKHKAKNINKRFIKQEF